MNKAFKKYKCKYKHTRYAKRKVAIAFWLRRAVCASAYAQGASMVEAIKCSRITRGEKLASIAEVTVNTHKAAMAAAKKITIPRWR